MKNDEINISCELVHDHTVNYAMQQNHVPLVKRLCLINNGSKDIEQLTITITTEPEFSTPWSTTIAALPGGQRLDLGVIDIQLAPAFLGSLTERLAGMLIISIKDNEKLIYSSTSPIDILSYDEWNGTRSLPEIIAAFVFPNHPDIASILHGATAYLQERTGNPSLDGYQSKDHKRVRQQIASIYSALQAKEIAYSVPPASFEEQGQKIRTPDIINEHLLGTCLDLTLLFAACTEAAGLHPIIIFTQDHAFLGVWLVDESFAESLQDDVTLLTKRIVAGVDEICVIETTALTAAKNCPFDEAVETAENKLRDTDQFHFFIDIHRARISQIRPLPLRTNVPFVVEDTVASSTDSINDYHPVTVASVPADDKNTGTRTRLQQWERSLLDLSLRNPLLNFRITGSTIPLLTAALSDLEDALADGNDFQIHPRPTDWETTPRDSSVYQGRIHSNPQVKLLQAEFAQHRLRADIADKDLSNRLTKLYRAARTSLEENGTSTFYLTLGTLIWYEMDNSEKPRHAPVLLIPMEIIRKSVQSGYLVRAGEDEPQLNITLLEMLRQDFGIDITGLDTLPTDEHGIDVQKVFTIIRRAIIHKARWDVIEDAYLGLFSFSKFVMWHDLKARNQDLLKNKVVKSLMAGSIQWQPTEACSGANLLDNTYHPKDIICPVSADSSQLMAVTAAGEGRSIVLHGPPGTGKSQTITNIIAHSLAQGKTVLFVAEKMAALSVVQRRLDQIGLAPFCLELHSNKTRKKDVLNQLNGSLESARINNPQNWEQEANRLAKLRGELNDYVLALHRDRSIGHSFFHGLSRLSAVRDASPVVVFQSKDVNNMNPDTLERWESLTRQLKIAGKICGHPHRHPWEHSHPTDYLPQMRSQLGELLPLLLEQIQHWQTTVYSVAEILDLKNHTDSYQDLMHIMEITRLFIDNPAIPGTMIAANDWDEVRSAVDRWIDHGLKRDTLREAVFTRYTERVLQLDIAALQEILASSMPEWFLPRWLGQYQVKKALQKAVKPGVQIDSEELEQELRQLQNLCEEERVLSSASDRARSLLGKLWQDGNANWDAVASACQWTEEIRKVAAKFSGTDLSRMEALRTQWASIITEHSEQLKPGAPLGEQFRALIKAGETVINTWQIISSLAVMESIAFTNNPESPGWFAYIFNRIEQWIAHLDGLRDWCTWSRTKAEALAADLKPLITPYEQGKLTHNELEPAFIRGFYQAWAEYEMSQDAILSSFSRGLFEDKIKQFRELDDYFAQLSREEVYARLAAKIPKITGDAAQNSEVGILQREILKQRNHMALRKLFQKIPNVLIRLKPCLLMSPMSVAQYLDPAYPPFDLIIFDEASQVPTCDAVGAIARGKELIVVGDPKQLPPTTFFNTLNNEEDEEYLALQDLESILDDCLAIQMPQERLKWHYRSRHESLIAFSNYQYYENSLYTFPSPDDLKPAVHLYQIDGFYDRGKSKQNRAEGEAVVNEILRRLNDPRLNKSSIGVVTFSQAQQRLIEDMLDEQLRHRPELEHFFSAEEIEPVFVKNLENVQGDERDVIMFSIGYGPDALGRVSLNFGPLNKTGGWRRLNVAVSRARKEMLVFSTLRADQIDLSRTSSQGVADLKAFLEYAQHGKQSLYSQPAVSADAEPESVFEEQIINALEARGHHVHPQVGCSGYRIDIAVIDPEHPGKYLLGIECDGATYHRAKTARDRDKLREAVLRQLGWEIHRVWSTDWWENPEREIERIEQAIEDAKTKSTRHETSPNKPVVEAPARIAQNVVKPVEVEQEIKSNATEYRICELPLVSKIQEEFYLDANNHIIYNQIMQVVNLEGPISHNLLCRRIIQAWGISKIGSRIDTRIRKLCLKFKLVKTKYDTSTYYWPENCDPMKYTSFRVPGIDKMTRRSIEDIPPEEIQNGCLEILRNQISLPEEDLIREAARLFGYQRKGPTVEMHIKHGIDQLVKRGRANRDADNSIVVAE